MARPSDRSIIAVGLLIPLAAFDNALDALLTDQHRHADIHILDAVFASEISGAWQNALLILEIGFSHCNRRCSRCVESRTCLQERNDFTAADPAIRAEGVARLKTWIEVAAKIGAPTVRAFADSQPPFKNWQQAARNASRDAVETYLADAAQLASLADETPEGRSIVVLAKESFNLRAKDLSTAHTFIPFTAQTRMSGVDVAERVIRKGAADSVAVARPVYTEPSTAPIRPVTASTRAPTCSFLLMPWVPPLSAGPRPRHPP